MNPTAEKYITELLTPYFTGEEKFSVDENGHCAYVGQDGANCVFGKACIDPGSLPGSQSAYVVIEEKGFEVLKPEAIAANLSSDQWNDVQKVHDYASLGHNYMSICKPLQSLSKIGPFTELRATIQKWHKEKALAAART